MQYVDFGRTGLRVSRLGFGGIPVQRIDEPGTRAMLKAAHEAGINYIDTARAYTVSEEWIGQALEELGLRDEFILATKCRALTKAEMEAELVPAVPAVKSEHHIAADGQIQFPFRVLRGQHLHREHRVVAAARLGLGDLPAADFQLRGHGLLPLCQLPEAAAHLQPQRRRGSRVLFEGRKPCRHHHHPVRADTGSSGPQVVQVAVVGRVEAAAIEQRFHLTTLNSIVLPTNTS